MATRNKFNKTEIRDFLEVIANENEGYIKCAGNIIYNGNVNLTTKISTIENNIANIITTDNNQTSNITNLQTLQVADRSNITTLQNIQIADRSNITNLQNLQVQDRANITNNTSNIASINSALNNCSKLNMDNNFLGNITFNNYLPTTTITSFTNNNQFVSKGYVDSAISGTTNLASSNFDWTGNHSFNVNLPTSNIVPNSAYQLVNKSYVDSVVSSGSSSLFSQNNTWTNTNTFSNIVLNGVILTDKFTNIDNNIGNLQGNISNIEISLNTNTTTNNTQNSRLDAIELLNISQNSNIANNTSNIANLQSNISNIEASLATNTTTNNTQNSRLDAIESLNITQTDNITSLQTENANQNSNIATLQNDVLLKANIANPSFSGSVNLSTINSNNLATDEILCNDTVRINGGFFYKDGTNYINGVSKINEKLNIANGIASNLTINTANLNNSTFTGTVSGLTKTNVGLSNVDNTSDANKPVSTATQTQLNLRLLKTNDTLQYCNILNSTFDNPTFTGDVNMTNLTLSDTILSNNYRWNIDYISGNFAGMSITANPTKTMYIINSTYNGTFEINLYEMTSGEDGMIFIFRKLMNKSLQFICNGSSKIYPLSLTEETNKTYTGNPCITMVYRNTGKMYIVLSEN
jgi:hypothetical protein